MNKEKKQKMITDYYSPSFENKETQVGGGLILSFEHVIEETFPSSIVKVLDVNKSGYSWKKLPSKNQKNPNCSVKKGIPASSLKHIL